MSSKIPFDSIPTKYITPNVILSYIENGEHISFEKIPQNMITKEIMNLLYMKNSKYHFSQGNQNQQITEWLYEIYKEHEGIHTMIHHF